MKDKIKVYPVLLSRQGGEHFMADGSVLPMGCLTSYVKHYQQGKLLNYFDIKPLVNRGVRDWGYYAEEAERNGLEPAIWLFSSYVWNAKDNLKIAAEIKQKSPGSLIVMGGPHVPGYPAECEDFFRQNPFVDIAARGEGEKTLADILETIVANSGVLHADFSAVNGITFRKGGEEYIRTPDRERSKSLDEFPSPALTGEFEDRSFDDISLFVLETNRGCPYGCTYCDWGAATLQKIRHFDLERVKKEIDYIGRKRIQNVHVADANFGAFERDVEIAKAVVAANKKYGFPKKFTCSNSKNASSIIGRVIHVLTEGGLITQGVIAIQTIDETVLDAVNRSNIKTKNLEKLMGFFKEENLVLSSELLIGLPGQTYDLHKKDLQYIFDRKMATMVYQVQIMPNAPMNEPYYREQHKIIANDEGYVVSTSSFNENDLRSMCTLFLAFQFYYLLGVLKYFLYYMQMEHGIKSMDFVDKLLAINEKDQDFYPISFRINRDLLKKVNEKNAGILELHWKTEDSAFIFDHLEAYYEEVFNFARRHFGVKISPSVAETLGCVQRAVMPELGKKVPMVVSLPHDFVAYFQQVKQVLVADVAPEDFKSLEQFPPGTLPVQALRAKTIDNLTLVMADTKTGFGWELRSPLRFVKPKVRFGKKGSS